MASINVTSRTDLQTRMSSKHRMNSLPARGSRRLASVLSEQQQSATGNKRKPANLVIHARADVMITYILLPQKPVDSQQARRLQASKIQTQSKKPSIC